MPRAAFADAFGGSIEAIRGRADDILAWRPLSVDPRRASRTYPALVLLEPVTEGRLAASLARHGEGPAAAWVGAPVWSRWPVGDRQSQAARGRSDRSAAAGRPGRTDRIASSRRRAGYHHAMTDSAAMTLRPATTDDADAIAALFTDEGYPAGPSDIAARLARFDPPDGAVIVAEHDGALLGFIAIHVAAPLRARRLDPAHPRAGRGRRCPRARRRPRADGRGGADRRRSSAPPSSS